MNETSVNMMMAVSYKASEMISGVIGVYILLDLFTLSEAQYISIEALMKYFINETTKVKPFISDHSNIVKTKFNDKW